MTICLSADSLNSTVKELAQLIVSDPCIESAFLGALGNMEEVASREIIKSITPETPQEYFLDIITHAQDEHRHAFQLRALKPVKDYQDARYYHLERKLSELGINFVLGFFGQKLLMQARTLNRFAGYVHGALTIEQVPLQLYAGYLKATKQEAVRKGMPAVLKDEFEHLELGKKLYATLPLEQQMSIDEINSIELEMCELLARKMYQTITEFKSSEQPKANTLEDYLSADRKRLALWISVLANVEKEKGHSKIAEDLKHSVSFLTNKELVSGNLGSTVDVLTNAENSWFFQHYKNLSEKSDLIGVCYALDKAHKHYLSANVPNHHVISEVNHKIQQSFSVAL